MAIFILALIAFVIADIAIRYIGQRMAEQRQLKEREGALSLSLKLDFSREAKSLKRSEVNEPKARILAVDDEPVVLDSLRKILVLEGYSVDTVEDGREALGLLQTHHYDFVFTDLKMPNMDGLEVTQSVKHLRPDIDVVIITGFATVETAVECMKYGATDYVQKPFTDDELAAFVKNLVFKRHDRIEKQLKPRVQITHIKDLQGVSPGEFAIPGGVFISSGHCWAALGENGAAKIGIDDFARKIIGRVDGVDFPNLGMTVAQGQPLFTVKQGPRRIPFASPLSGRVTRINDALKDHLEGLSRNPYENNWVCTVDTDKLDQELTTLKIGNAAVALFQEDIDRARRFVQNIPKAEREKSGAAANGLTVGELEKMDEKNGALLVNEVFGR